MYRGIIFDLDGVIRHFGDAHLRAAAERYRIDSALILEAAFRCAAFDDALIGRLEAEAWHAVARQNLSAAAGRDVGGAIDEFIAFPGWVDTMMLDLVDRLRMQLRVGLLSNGTTRLESHLTHHELHTHFDAIVNTARIGVAKPAAESYLIAAGRLGVEPSACVFVDDRRTNVEGANVAGLTGLRFSDQSTLETDLRRLGIEL